MILSVALALLGYVRIKIFYKLLKKQVHKCLNCLNDEPTQLALKTSMKKNQRSLNLFSENIVSFFNLNR